MLKRWNVHHGAQDLGLMTAKEIRDALRKGTLDPFDKVSAEGSNIREDLIEVDEIFVETEADDEGTNSQPSIQAPLATADGAVAVPMPAQAQAQQPKIQAAAVQAPTPAAASKASAPKMIELEESPRTAPPPSTAAFSPSWKNADTVALLASKDDKDSKSTQKRFYLIDKAKVLGPLSALEIQSLFNRGGLNAKVKVQKIGGTKAIPIAQFIASFSEDRIKELTEDGKLNQKVSSPSSKVLNELARAASAQKIAKDRKNKTYLILGLAGFLLGALILVVFDSSQSPKRSNTESVEQEGKKSRPKLLQKQDEEEAPREVTRPRVKRETPKQDTTPVSEAPVVVRKVQPRDPPKVIAKPAARPATVAKKAPPPKAVAVVKPKPVEAAPSKGSIERALSSGGGVQTVGPLSFSITALEACSSKCTLTLRDSTGMTIKAVFFKSAYYDQLKKSGGNAMVSGTVRREGSGASILIQDVR